MGLAYLHSEGLIHGDLHAGNVLIDDEGSARLTDFGMSLISEGTGYNYGSTHGGGAVRWTAPELIDPEEFELETTRATFFSDVYAFAMTAIEVMDAVPHFRKPPCLFHMFCSFTQASDHSLRFTNSKFNVG